MRKVRDNAAVRYRIAACLESLGRLREARELYLTVVGEGAKPTAEDAEIQAAGRTKAQDLDKRIPTLAVRTVDGAAATLTIDGRAAQLGEAVPVDPGEHRVVLTRPGVQAAESRANVLEGAHVALSIPLTAPAMADPASSPTRPASSTAAARKSGWAERWQPRALRWASRRWCCSSCARAPSRTSTAPAPVAHVRAAGKGRSKDGALARRRWAPLPRCSAALASSQPVWGSRCS